MNKQKETINVSEVHDNSGHFVIDRNIIEEVNGDELLKIYGDISKALDDAKKQLEEMPKQIEERTKFLQDQVSTLERRIVCFEKHGKALKEAQEKKEKEELEANKIKVNDTVAA